MSRRVLLDGVVHRRVERRARAVVVDGQPAADVEVLERVAALVELRVVHRGLAHGALDGQDVRDLRADVEVQQLERRRPCSPRAVISIASRISAVDSPNFACSPPEVAHFPAPFDSRRTRRPIHGSTPISVAIFVISSTSEIFSAMRMTFLPSFRPISAVRM